MTQITSIAVCNAKLDSGLVLLYGAQVKNGMADQIFYLTRNDLLTRKFTGMDYHDLAESDDGVTSLIDGDDYEEDAVVEGYCLVNRKRIAVDLSTMPGIAVVVGEVVDENTSVFAPFVDFSEDAAEQYDGMDFLISADKARCIHTGEVVSVAFDDDLDGDFAYVAIIDGELIRVNAFGYTRHGEVRLEPVAKSEDYEPLADQYIAQEGTLHIPKDAEPAFVSKYLTSLAGPAAPTPVVKLKAYSIHHKEDGRIGLAIDLA